MAEETDLDTAKALSERLGNRVLLKREDMQPVFSFKLRGAYNKMASLSEKELSQGVIAASAGNHAQGVAMSATHLGVKATIVMPRTTPPIKVQSVRRFGGKAVLKGDSYDDAYEHAQQLVKEKGLTFIHPYDDPEVIAGQGTVAQEILRQTGKDLHAVFVPVGGGGLLAGVAVYIKTVFPDIKVIGVESEESACLHAALKAGRRVTLPTVGIFADGVAVKQIGKETFKVASQTVDDVVLVSNDEICAAIKDIFEDTRSIAEPAGALAVAGLKKYVADTGVSDENMVAIVSGANVNFDRLRYVSERAEVGEQREALFAVAIPEEPGSFLAFCRDLEHRPITEFNYRYADAQEAQIFVGVRLSQGNEEREELLKLLKEKGYKVTDLTDNELAKDHTRYMVGGHAPQLNNEYLYRFEFPERPGALQQFLTKLGKRFNISLFHYRNHGSDYGRVLLGIQLNKEDRQGFAAFLKEMGYAWWDETKNPAYRLFTGTF